MKKRNKLSGLVGVNQIGLLAIRHKDGWWVGTEKGVTCYARRDIAQAALTIVWQREGGQELNYRLAPFTGADKCTGEHTPPKSAAQAIKDYEAKGS